MILDSHVGEDRGRNEAGEGGIVEAPGIHDGREGVQALDVLGEQLDAYASERLEPLRALVALDRAERAQDLVCLIGERRDVARRERIGVGAHLLGRGDDDLHGDVP